METSKTFNCIIKLTPGFDNIILEKDFLKINLNGISVYDFRKSVFENFVSGTGEGNFYDYFEKNALVRFVRNDEELRFEVFDNYNNEDVADYVLVSNEYMVIPDDETMVFDSGLMNEFSIFSVSSPDGEIMFTIVTLVNLDKLKEYNLSEYNEIMNIDV